MARAEAFLFFCCHWLVVMVRPQPGLPVVVGAMSRWFGWLASVVHITIALCQLPAKTCHVSARLALYFDSKHEEGSVLSLLLPSGHSPRATVAHMRSVRRMQAPRTTRSALTVPLSRLPLCSHPVHYAHAANLSAQSTIVRRIVKLALSAPQNRCPGLKKTLPPISDTCICDHSCPLIRVIGDFPFTARYAVT